ncbi:MAG: B12-binding domain-containing radical SAM protein [Deltaproteobacteria bacterium]|nr:B12-binding domain-containing radical SAM protein [Deltaproteobacteria bacterium]
MRVLFFHQVAESIGLEYLSAALAADGHEVGLVFDPGFRNHPYVDLGALSVLGPTWDEVLARVRGFRPDLVGVSVWTNLVGGLSHFARLVRERLGVPVVAGGVHATMLPRRTAEAGWADFVCVGEGEDVIRELARALERGESTETIPGLWTRRADGTVVEGPNRAARPELDALPFPDRELFRREGVAESALACNTLRGCPFRCTYCTNTALQDLHRERGVGKFLRRRSVPSVVSELVEAKARYRPRSIAFVDELFALDERWVEELAGPYRERVGLPFWGNAYPLLVSDRMLRALVAAGCTELAMGLEVGSERVNEAIRARPMPTTAVLDAARRIRAAGIRLYVDAIFGFPDETPADLWSTVELAAESRADAVKSFVFFPLPGTPLLRECVDRGLLTAEDEAAIEDGHGSYHGRSPLRYAHADLAFSLSRMLPVYVAAPRWLRPLLARLMRRPWGRLARFVHVASYPFFVDGAAVRDFAATVKVGAMFRLRALLGSESDSAERPLKPAGHSSAAARG